MTSVGGAVKVVVAAVVAPYLIGYLSSLSDRIRT